MPSPAARIEDPHEIPWPTIFFWMACFALNSISQPTGRMLGTRYRHQPVLRGSPILCAFDSVNILVSWFIYLIAPTTSPTSIRQAAARVLLERVTDDSCGNPDLIAIKDTKAQSRVRWFGFLLGVLPSAIKLFVSKGIPLSQVAGAMYLASWLIFELLVLVAQIDEKVNKTAAHETAVNETVDNPADEEVGEKNNRETDKTVNSVDPGIRYAWAIVAMIAHMLIFCLPVSAQRDFLNKRSWSSIFTGLMNPFMTFSIPLWSRPLRDPDLETTRASLFRLTVCAVIQFIHPVLEFWDLGNKTVQISLFCAAALVAGVFGLLALRWARTVIVSLHVLNLLVQWLFFYIFLYDPVGTYQPSWLRWFG
ncbi:hypothetical protein BJY04DRAFT_201423 [Aspergillus karnatakaensis]|uniref:uncharacterized protein n=1 Tax=Aspergillus karnatakaensis TaxID=1810916 RepID=UPI003CCD808E